MLKTTDYKVYPSDEKTIQVEEDAIYGGAHIALETIERHDKYSGKRIKRGLFISSTGKLINADINGSIGIALKSKVVQDGRRFIGDLLNTGMAQMPVKHNLINNPIKCTMLC